MKKPAKNAYRDILAYIHDAGFGRHAQNAAATVLKMLKKQGTQRGQVVDLGCGSGILAGILSRAGYDVLGFDISRSMVELARKHAPGCDFRCESFLTARLPKSVAVTAVGEIFNYLFDENNTKPRLERLFERVYRALEPRGLFLFDVDTAGRVPELRRRSFMEGDDWVCLVDAEEDPKRKRLVRRIISFRKENEHYRRDDEIHRLRLYDPRWIAARLCKAGFRVRSLSRYGKLKFPPGYAAFLARKPGRSERAG